MSRKMPLPPQGWAYGIDTDYWRSVREGSNIEVPNFRRFTGPSRFPLATGKSKKLYLRAVSRALCNAARFPPMRVVREATTGDEGVAARAFYRLRRLGDRT